MVTESGIALLFTKYFTSSPRSFSRAAESKVLLDHGVCICVLKCEHAAAGVLNKQDLVSAQQLL